jgi:sterol 3beta-glucosyltransferase
MRITVVAMSGQGDTEPFLGLAARLARAGHEVTFAARPDFAEQVASSLAFASVGKPYQAFIARAAEAGAMGSGHPWQKLKFGIRERGYVTDGVHDDTVKACQDAELIVYKYPLLNIHTVAEALDVPCVAAMLLPLIATRAFPSFTAGRGIDRGPIINRLVWEVPWQAIWQGLRLDDRKLRRRLGLAPLPRRAPTVFRQRPDAPLLCAWSERVLPLPGDWPTGVHATGYWFTEPAMGWEPPAGLARFVEAGPPPVSIGFGSMVSPDTENTLDVVLEAVERAEQRAVLLGGWTGLGAGQGSLPAHVFAIDKVPHEWLFPRTAAVVHHGGAGTTAAALRAGAPAVITPFLADQPSWARVVHGLGAGPAPIPFSELSADRLGPAIQEAVTHPTFRREAQEVAAGLRGEDGVGRAMELIFDYASRYRRTGLQA